MAGREEVRGCATGGEGGGRRAQYAHVQDVSRTTAAEQQSREWYRLMIGARESCGEGGGSWHMEGRGRKVTG